MILIISKRSIQSFTYDEIRRGRLMYLHRLTGKIKIESKDAPKDVMNILRDHFSTQDEILLKR